MNDDEAQREMPKYVCHKEVWALKIGGFAQTVGEPGMLITPADEGYAAFTVDQEYVDKHDPQVGGYYVVYEDGYKSFSPAHAFESGYSLIE